MDASFWQSELAAEILLVHPVSPNLGLRVSDFEYLLVNVSIKAVVVLLKWSFYRPTLTRIVGCLIEFMAYQDVNECRESTDV